MMKKIEKTANLLIAISLILLLTVSVFPDLVSGAMTVSATVSSIMVECTTPMDGQTNNFGTIDNTAVYTATTTTTTINSSGAVYFKVNDQGSTTTPGLFKTPDLIESPWATTTDASATISAAMEGYGIQATNSAGTILINTRYDKYSYAAWVGALETSTNAQVLASSGSNQANQLVSVKYKVSVAIATPSGAYADTITFTCSATP